jgi:lipid-binding SYLF domain-containing protein
MKKAVWKIAMVLCVLLTLFGATASAQKKTLDERKAEIHQKVAVTLDKLYASQPKARRAIKTSAGYAVFVNSGYKLGIVGSSHGRGLAVNNATKKEVYMRMQEYQAGLGLGAKEYAIVFVFGNQDAWDSFVKKGWSFGGQGTAAVTDGVAGGTMEGAFQVAPGIWVYQLTTKGLALEIGLKGTNYYRDKSYYPEEKKAKAAKKAQSTDQQATTK